MFDIFLFQVVRWAARLRALPIGAFSREQCDGGSAHAAGDDDGLTGESRFGNLVLKLVVRVRLTRVTILRGHVLPECRCDLLHV